MKALKFIINGEEQDIPQGWWDGIGKTLYLDYDNSDQGIIWVLSSNATINDIQNNVVLVFRWDPNQMLGDKIYDSDGNYIEYSISSSSWDNSIDDNGILVGIMKKENADFIFYPRYWGTSN